jgi:alpha-methylacyl-CoA racemase
MWDELDVQNGEKPGKNMIDSGFPCFDTYQCKDGKYMSVGALEPKFFANFLKVIYNNFEIIWKGLDLPEEQIKKYRKGQMNPTYHKEMRELFEKKMLEKTRDEWTKIVA